MTAPPSPRRRRWSLPHRSPESPSPPASSARAITGTSPSPASRPSCMTSRGCATWPSWSPNPAASAMAWSLVQAVEGAHRGRRSGSMAPRLRGARTRRPRRRGLPPRPGRLRCLPEAPRRHRGGTRAGRGARSSFGLSGRERRACSATERARVAVRRAIKTALDRIAEHAPTLAEHLERNVRTGAFWCYEPERRAAMRWVV